MFAWIIAILLGMLYIISIVFKANYILSYISWGTTYFSFLWQTFPTLRKWWAWFKIFIGQSQPIVWDVVIKIPDINPMDVKENVHRFLSENGLVEIKDGDTFIYTANKLGTIVLTLEYHQIDGVTPALKAKRMEHHFKTSKNTLKFLLNLSQHLKESIGASPVFIVTLYTDAFKTALKRYIKIPDAEVRSASVYITSDGFSVHLSKNKIEFFSQYPHEYNMKTIVDVFLTISTNGGV